MARAARAVSVPSGAEPRGPSEPRTPLERDLGQALVGVLDLRDGRAVHAIAGQRERYAVIDRPWCPGGDPRTLAMHYQRLGVSGLYIADLDSITEGRSRSTAVYDSIAALGLPMWLDAGSDGSAWGIEKGAGEHVPSASSAVRRVIGTESLRGVDHLRALLERTPLTVSLDLYQGRVRSECSYFRGLSANACAAALIHEGIDELIVLDLADVGTGRGPSTGSLCQWIAGQGWGVRVISGGGVRDSCDVRALVASGCERVLAATWLQALVPGEVKRRNV